MKYLYASTYCETSLDKIKGGKEGKGRRRKKERTHIRIEWNSYKRWNKSYCFMLFFFFAMVFPVVIHRCDS